MTEWWEVRWGWSVVGERWSWPIETIPAFTLCPSKTKLGMLAFVKIRNISQKAWRPHTDGSPNWNALQLRSANAHLRRGSCTGGRPRWHLAAGAAIICSTRRCSDGVDWHTNSPLILRFSQLRPWQESVVSLPSNRELKYHYCDVTVVTFKLPIGWNCQQLIPVRGAELRKWRCEAGLFIIEYLRVSNSGIPKGLLL